MRTILDLERIDSRFIAHDNHNEIRLFAVVRNESLRLPFFIEYYRKLGVDRFFFIDNDSTDPSKEIVLSNNDTYLFSTKESYSSSSSGIDWLNALHQEYGLNTWSLFIDADEILVYPNSETQNLRSLAKILENDNSNVLKCILLDMYSKNAIKDCNYISGQDPATVCQYFDSDNYYLTNLNQLSGGPRRRVFSIDVCLDKFAFFKFNSPYQVGIGAHLIGEEARISKLRGASLHYKFIKEFCNLAHNEVVRNEQWNNACEYKTYSQFLKSNPSCSFWSKESQKYENTQQLEQLGLIGYSTKLPSQ